MFIFEIVYGVKNQYICLRYLLAFVSLLAARFLSLCLFLD